MIIIPVNYDGDKKYKTKIVKAINEPVSADMDEGLCREWMSLLPECKRYISQKIAVANRRINDINFQIDMLEAKTFETVRKTFTGAVSERKAIAENKFRLDEEYRELYNELTKYKSLIDEYRADLDNLSEKSYAVRKYADFERVHLMYETD